MKKFWLDMLSDVDGQISSKRFITLIAFMCLATAFWANIFVQIPLEEFVYDGMLYLTASGLGFSTFEKFSRKESTNSTAPAPAPLPHDDCP